MGAAQSRVYTMWAVIVNVSASIGILHVHVARIYGGTCDDMVDQKHK